MPSGLSALVGRAAARCVLASGLLLGTVQAQPAPGPTPGAATSSLTAAPIDPAREALEARVMALAAELRCLVCQNQTIADSDAGLARDLRRIIREMLTAGRTEAEVIDFMAQRYGDFVLYRPPLQTRTWLLWAGPALMAAAGALALGLTLRRRQRLPDSAFEPDTVEDPDHAPR